MSETFARSQSATFAPPAVAHNSSAIVVAEGLVKKYGPKTVVNHVSFEVRAGEIFGLLGPNGAGKSTTIGMISTYIGMTEGQVVINGWDLRTKPGKIKEIIGVVPQELAIYEENTCEENMNFFADIFGMSSSQRKETVYSLLEAVGLWDRRKEVVKKYSGGMKRRLNLAIGLINDPLFLMLDEPTVGVDPQSRQSIFDLIARMKAAGKAILYTTQYMEEAEQLCDRIAIMDNGQIIAQGTLDELLESAQQKIVVEKPRGLSQLFLQLTGRELRD